MQASHFGAVHWLNRVMCLTQADYDALNVRHTQNEMCIHAIVFFIYNKISINIVVENEKKFQFWICLSTFIQSSTKKWSYLIINLRSIRNFAILSSNSEIWTKKRFAYLRFSTKKHFACFLPNFRLDNAIINKIGCGLQKYYCVTIATSIEYLYHKIQFKAFGHPYSRHSGVCFG